MLETILDHLHNHFEIRGAERAGEFEVVSGAISLPFLQDGQYYLIRGSVFNDGLHRYPETGMEDERFTGEVIPLAVPQKVISLSEEIAQWCEQNPVTDKISESFGGYSYTRGSGRSGNESQGGWQSAFRYRLNVWKKVG